MCKVLAMKAEEPELWSSRLTLGRLDAVAHIGDSSILSGELGGRDKRIPRSSGAIAEAKNNSR